MNDFMQEIRAYKKPTQKKLRKLGTIAIDIVESTPVVWKGRLLRFEWKRNFNREHRDPTFTVGYYHFVDMETGEETPPFAHTYTFGSAYVENDTMYVVGGQKWGTNVLDIFISKDLVNWEKKNIISYPEGWEFYNTSICKGEDGYVMAIEIGAPLEVAGVRYTMIFAKSKDLLNWEILDTNKFIHTPERYSACPVIRYSEGYYYMIYLEEMPLYKFVPYIARSKDLAEWEVAPVNPVMFYSDEDKKLYANFTEDEKERIDTSLNTNNSDVDLCEYNGKTIILYSWGNQCGWEYLALAEYDGTMSEFFKSFF